MLNYRLRLSVLRLVGAKYRRDCKFSRRLAPSFPVTSIHALRPFALPLGLFFRPSPSPLQTHFSQLPANPLGARGYRGGFILEFQHLISDSPPAACFHTRRHAPFYQISSIMQQPTSFAFPVWVSLELLQCNCHSSDTIRSKEICCCRCWKCGNRRSGDEGLPSYPLTWYELICSCP